MKKLLSFSVRYLGPLALILIAAVSKLEAPSLELFTGLIIAAAVVSAIVTVAWFKHADKNSRNSTIWQ